ncbi:hypothetical protein [Thermoflexibacter ruber]|uniref:Uncharacterized protein n=1 Tax=Thermoflexibacter ruber TaxID=1003 RepID=A0A1I2FVW3_9BACT|nr:hypothetical protein [Thermoflexibacter ruber]SFF09532.1 hypothetical protein SAMN04488541_1015105 [Thermoflexibacter ruber]
MFVDNADKEYLTKLLNDSLSTDIEDNEEIIVLTGYTCLTCYDNKKLVYSINQYAGQSNKPLIGIVFSKISFHNELENLRSHTAKNINWIETNNIDLMILLSRITNDKDGPYYIKFENKEVIEITAF